MRQILRSIIDFDGSLSPTELVLNIHALKELPPPRPDSSRIVQFVVEFERTHRKAPGIRIVRGCFSADGEVWEFLNEIAEVTPLSCEDFRERVAELTQAWKNTEVANLLRDAIVIIEGSLCCGEGDSRVTLSGIEDGLQYLHEGLERIQARTEPPRPPLGGSPWWDRLTDRIPFH